MRPQQLVGAVERSFVEEVLVLGSKLRPKRVRIAAAAHRALRVGYFQMVGKGRAATRDPRLKQPVGMDFSRGKARALSPTLHDPYARRLGQERAHDQSVV